MLAHRNRHTVAAAVLLLLCLAASLAGAQEDPAAVAPATLGVTAAESVATEPALTTDPAPQAATAVKAGPRSVSVISTRKAGGIITAQPGQRALPINRRIKALPGLRALTKRQMDRQYTGAAAPRAFHSARDPAGDVSTKANGLAGASFSDSRFSPEYYTLGQQRIGQLYMRFSENWYVCSASVINRALLVTAAHCLCFQEQGRGDACLPDVVNGTLQVGFELGLTEPQPSSFRGTWSAAGIMVPRPYMQQTDTNLQLVVSNNDLALVWLNPKDEVQVGDVAGWNSYGINGFSFAAPLPSWGFPAAPASAMMSALGYPCTFDDCSTPQISNSAVYSAVFGGSTGGSTKPPPPGMNPTGALKQMIRGSSFTGGSSGGPWIANYGIDANVTEGAAGYGFNAQRNVVLGVTSWGYVAEEGQDPISGMAQGASFFGVNKEYPGTYGDRGSGNIASLMYDACDNPAFEDWKLASKGLCE